MFERFTDMARKAMHIAGELAKATCESQIRPSHVFLGNYQTRQRARIIYFAKFSIV
jgi:hypothetical protein